MVEELFGEFERVLSHGLVEPPESVGKSYHLSLEGGDFIRIRRNFIDIFRYTLYESINGEYLPTSDGVVANLKWKKLLEEKL